MVSFVSSFDAMWCLTGKANGQRGHNAKRKAVAVRLICRGCGTVEIEQFDRTKIFGLHPVPRGKCKVCLKRLRDERYPLPKLPKAGGDDDNR